MRASNDSPPLVFIDPFESSLIRPHWLPDKLGNTIHVYRIALNSVRLPLSFHEIESLIILEYKRGMGAFAVISV